MRRTLIMLAGWLVFGAIVTVVVAWGCAAFITFSNPDDQIDVPYPSDELAFAWDRAGARRVYRSPRRTGGRPAPPPVDVDFLLPGAMEERMTALDRKLEASRLARRDFEANLHSGYSIRGGTILIYDRRVAPVEWVERHLAVPRETRFSVIDLRGWPFFSMRNDATLLETGGSQVHGGIELEQPEIAWSDLHTLRALPLQPVWPGFALSTLLYGLGPPLLLWFFLGSRGCVRRWRGRCPKCGYDVRAGATCSECGWGADS